MTQAWVTGGFGWHVICRIGMTPGMEEVGGNPQGAVPCLDNPPPNTVRG